MFVRLFLKSYVEIGFVPISIFEIKYQPLYAIPYKEWQIEQFTLLFDVNHFVIRVILVKGRYSKNELRKRNCQKAFAKWVFLYVYHFRHDYYFWDS